jgi:hypothetical protein
VMESRLGSPVDEGTRRLDLIALIIEHRARPPTTFNISTGAGGSARWRA